MVWCLVGACTRQESAREIDWAKAALARNPAYEIVATDESAGVFTVRSTTTGRFETLKLQDLIAAPLPPKAVAQPAPAPASEPVESPADASDATGTLASGQTTDAVEATPEVAEGAIAQGPGYSIQRGDRCSAQRVSRRSKGRVTPSRASNPRSARQLPDRKSWTRASSAAPIPSSARVIA